MNMSFLLAVESALLLACIAVSIVRWSIGHKEDDQLHVLDSDKDLVPVQAALAHKLDVVDRWRRVLITGAVIVGVALIIMHAYSVWQQNSVTGY
jgi:hypothetical protein